MELSPSLSPIEKKEATVEHGTKLKLEKVLQEVMQEQQAIVAKNKEYQRRLTDYFKIQRVGQDPKIKALLG